MRIVSSPARACLLLVCGLMVACASAPAPRADQAEGSETPLIAFESDAGLELLTQAQGQLVQSRIQAGPAERGFQYRADYSLSSGVLARSLSPEGDQVAGVPSELGRQSLVQALSLALPESFGAPVNLDVRSEQELRWSLAGEMRAESNRAHLQWQPKYLGLDLHWSEPRNLALDGQPLDCYARANLRLPELPLVSSLGATLDFSRDHCQVLAPARGVEGFDVAAEAVAWRWGASLDQSFSLRRLVPGWQPQPGAVFEPSWELGLAHRHELAGWQLGMNMAWRQIAAGNADRSDLSVPASWAADLMLRREFGLVALTARWLHANDPLWFVPLSSPVERERISLLVDFGQWLLRHWPERDAGMSASWDQVEDARGVDDHQFKWNLYLSW